MFEYSGGHPYVCDHCGADEHERHHHAEYVGKVGLGGPTGPSYFTYDASRMTCWRCGFEWWVKDGKKAYIAESGCMLSLLMIALLALSVLLV